MCSKKRSNCLLICILMCLCLVCVFLSSCGNDGKGNETNETDQGSSNVNTEGMTFELNEDGHSYTLTGLHNCSTEEGILVIPDEYNDLPVTKIGSVANGMSDFQIKKLVIPDTIEVIEERAFKNSTSLQSIDFGNGLKTIEHGAFAYCGNLKEINIPSCVTYLGTGSFSGCSQLNKVILSCNLETIFSGTFSECPELETLEMSESNTKYICKNNCLINKETRTLLFGCKGSVIPQDEGISYIASNAFSGCIGLSEVVFPTTLQAIGSGAFSDCTALSSITIPDAVQSIDGSAFSGCTSLTSVVIESKSNLKYIDSYAFGGCTSLTNIIIPNSVVKVGEDAFKDCSALSGVECGSAVYLGNQDNPYAFLLTATDRSLTSVNVHKDTKFISSLAFVNCTALERVQLPDGLLGIGGYAFAGCPIKEFKLPTTIRYLGEMPFSIGVDGEKVEDPDYTVLTKYDNAYYVGSTQNPYMVLVRVINTEITSCKVHPDTQIIYSFAFGECSRLKSIIFESNDNLKSIGETAFSGCVSLTSCTIPDSVESIGWLAFDACDKLIQNETGVYYVGNWAVGTDMALTDGAQKEFHFIIREGTKGIAGGIFNTSHIASIVLPQSLEYLGESCFGAISVDKLYYSDCECEYSNINIGFGNSEINNAQMFYYAEQQPCYWHFVDGVPTEWK